MSGLLLKTPRSLSTSQYASKTIYGTRTAPTRFWLGLAPPIRAPLSDLEAKMVHHLAVTLTSRIAGSHQWDMAKERGYGRGTERSGVESGQWNENRSRKGDMETTRLGPETRIMRRETRSARTATFRGDLSSEGKPKEHSGYAE